MDLYTKLDIKEKRKMRIYRNQFFKSKEEALAFKKERGGGSIYSNVKGSHTKKDYQTELLILGRPGDEEFANEYPYVVAWNQFM